MTNQLNKGQPNPGGIPNLSTANSNPIQRQEAQGQQSYQLNTNLHVDRQPYLSNTNVGQNVDLLSTNVGQNAYQSTADVQVGQQPYQSNANVGQNVHQLNTDVGQNAYQSTTVVHVPVGQQPYQSNTDVGQNKYQFGQNQFNANPDQDVEQEV